MNLGPDTVRARRSGRAVPLFAVPVQGGSGQPHGPGRAAVAQALHHLAFRADSDAEVDRLYEQVRAIEGVTIVAPPGRYPEYTPDYYAFFFKDTEGIKLEIVHFERPAYY